MYTEVGCWKEEVVFKEAFGYAPKFISYFLGKCPGIFNFQMFILPWWVNQHPSEVKISRCVAIYNDKDHVKV